ncbi:Hypothetical predicted protein [Mytilus galloprovincialis]|uniref:Uncharacterized protein n=1 Tax=Mytilus galloprovincialis TaxID=29158 RepID=A0A8B6HFS7_MYTGA|nr:Hypothetical predicted protein [Mytilus galloprovincialis]
MNGFYEMTIAKLQEWSVIPSGLINGDDLLWENAKGPQVYIPQMKLAPSSNPVNVNSLISAKQDKPVQWLKTSKLSIQNVCEIAMTKASQKRKNEGTRIEQIKKRFLENKEERAQKIAKRRKIRQERKRRLDESLKEAKLHLCRKKKAVKNMNKTQLLKQVKLWRALAEVQHVNSNDVLKNFNKLSPTEQVLHLKTIIGANKQLVIQEWESSLMKKLCQM